MTERAKGKAVPALSPAEEYMEPSGPVDPGGLDAEIEKIERQLERLREVAVQKIADAERVLQEARDELARIEGILKPGGRGIPPRHEGGKSERQNAPRGHWHGVVGDVLAKHPSGLLKREMINALKIRGDKRQEARLSSAIQLMKRSGHLTQGEDGRYRQT